MTTPANLRPPTPPAIEITQIALVVRDLDTTMAAYHDIFGWGPWQIVNFGHDIPLHNTTVRTEPTDYTMRVAVAVVGGLTVELIEPGHDNSHYREHLDTKGEGVHHIVCTTPDGATTRTERLLQARGIAPLMSGTIADAVDYTYYDATELLKVVIETAEVRPGGDPGVLAAITRPTPQAP